MPRSKKTTNPDTILAAAFAASGFTLPEKKEKEGFHWAAEATVEEAPAHTNTSSLRRTPVCGNKATGHPDGLLSIAEQAPLLMQDIMKGVYDHIKNYRIEN